MAKINISVHLLDYFLLILTYLDTSISAALTLTFIHTRAGTQRIVVDYMGLLCHLSIFLSLKHPFPSSADDSHFCFLCRLTLLYLASVSSSH